MDFPIESDLGGDFACLCGKIEVLCVAVVLLGDEVEFCGRVCVWSGGGEWRCGFKLVCRLVCVGWSGGLLGLVVTCVGVAVAKFGGVWFGGGGSTTVWWCLVLSHGVVCQVWRGGFGFGVVIDLGLVVVMGLGHGVLGWRRSFGLKVGSV